MMQYNFINGWNLDLILKLLHNPETWIRLRFFLFLNIYLSTPRFYSSSEISGVRK